MRISDWSSDVCSSDLLARFADAALQQRHALCYPVQLLLANVIRARVTGLDIRIAQQSIAALFEAGLARPDVLERRLQFLSQVPQPVQVMGLRVVERANKKKAVIDGGGGLTVDPIWTTMKIGRASCRERV